jgi:hypothetical protein
MIQQTITSQIEAKVFELLEENQEGIRWSDLNSKIKQLNPSFHPKTINGVIWKLPRKYPDKVYKPSKGIFKIIRKEI